LSAATGAGRLSAGLTLTGRLPGTRGLLAWFGRLTCGLSTRSLVRLSAGVVVPVRCLVATGLSTAGVVLLRLVGVALPVTRSLVRRAAIARVLPARWILPRIAVPVIGRSFVRFVVSRRLATVGHEPSIGGIARRVFCRLVHSAKRPTGRTPGGIRRTCRPAHVTLHGTHCLDTGLTTFRLVRRHLGPRTVVGDRPRSGGRVGDGTDPTRVYPCLAQSRAMRVTFLGTSGAVPTTERNPSAVFVNREGEELLFDCGEGTQRQMMRYGTGFSVDHVFLTHLHGDHVLGLPGLLQTWDFNDREAPLTIHVPPGTRATVDGLVTAIDTRPSYPVRIGEVEAGETALEHEEYVVEAVAVDHRTTAVGYALIEDDRKGRFDREKAEHDLGIPPGPKYSKLHEGEAVELDDGTVVEPEEVVGPPRPGRRLVYTGDTSPTDAVVEASEDADLLIHDGTFAQDRAERAAGTGHSTGRQAGVVAREAGAKRLALTHVSTRYAGRAGVIAEEASEVFDGECFVAADGQEIEVPYPDEA